MANVFISYSSSDRQYAEALATLLHKRGLTVWWDTELMPAEKFRDRIVEEIEASDVVIVLWSDESRISRWVPDEAKLALDEEKLIQISLDGKPQPTGFGQATINYSDLSNWRIEDYRSFDISIFEAVESYIPKKESLEVIKNRLIGEIEDSRLELKNVRDVSKFLTVGLLACAVASTYGIYKSTSHSNLADHGKIDDIENLSKRIDNLNTEFDERFKFLSSPDYKILWDEYESPGPHIQDLADIVPTSATAVILNVIVSTKSSDSGSFVCAGSDGKFNKTNWHYENISVTEYGHNWSGGVVICPLSESRSITWGMFSNGSKVTTSINVKSFGTLVGWL